MPFNTALSGIRAASNDLSVTGNNIANASTTGFKSARAEFGDIYATSVLGAGNNAIGGGVHLQNVAQKFTQGGISFTENELDLAVSGSGFFVLRQDGQQLYSRAGAFGLDKDGYVVTSSGARLQGLSADDNGNISGLQSDVRIQTTNLAPRATTRVESLLNLNATLPVLQSNGVSFSTEGNAIGVARSGLQQNTTTALASDGFTLPLAVDFNTQSLNFRIEMTAGSGNNGAVDINLNTQAGLPAQINTFNDLRTLASVINAQVFRPAPPQTPIDVIASAVDLGGGDFRLEFTSLQSGEASQIRIQNGSGNAGLVGLPVGPDDAASTPGIAAVGNGYPRQSIDITDPRGNTVTYTARAGASAATTASEMNAMAGVSATATTEMRILAGNYTNSNGNLQVTLNGVTVSGLTLESLGAAINAHSASTLPGVRAELDALTGDLVVRSSVGDDLRVSINSVDDGDRIGVLGNPNTPPELLEVDANNDGVSTPGAVAAAGNALVVGGNINLILAEGYGVDNPSPPAIGLFGPLTDDSFTSVVLNAFDPNNAATYNSATSVTIYDSLGNAHVMTQYFVRQEYDVNDPATAQNHWHMHVLINGRDVGDPDTTLAPPLNTLPSRATFDLYFNENGSLNRELSDEMLISNWQPVDSDGVPNGALGPQNVLAGGSTNVVTPPTSSNFVVDMTGTTQFGSPFAVNDGGGQNGYSTGRLSGVNIDKGGIIFARFTNGESQVLGQLILANFSNTQGLQPVGNTMWAENYESGPPNIGAPGTAALGVIQAGGLEESNVDLSEELVRLIIAQRNFQASAKTIETANQVTQTVINLR